uniref:Uncharacterized protein n=1 Tax=uncultured marine virus TaxID=186617 RepID=A0A0F7L720_9VIRU|nr:hypothetical protein [uncultured marine virus]
MATFMASMISVIRSCRLIRLMGWAWHEFDSSNNRIRRSGKTWQHSRELDYAGGI